jgi:Mg-chelatase subunit ChlI
MVMGDRSTGKTTTIRALAICYPKLKPKFYSDRPKQSDLSLFYLNNYE